MQNEITGNNHPLLSGYSLDGLIAKQEDPNYLKGKNAVHRLNPNSPIEVLKYFFTPTALTELPYNLGLIQAFDNAMIRLRDLQEQYPPGTAIPGPAKENLLEIHKEIQAMFRKVVLTLERAGFTIINPKLLAKAEEPTFQDKLKVLAEQTQLYSTVLGLVSGYLNQNQTDILPLLKFAIADPDTLTLHTIPNFTRNFTAQRPGAPNLGSRAANHESDTTQLAAHHNLWRDSRAHDARPEGQRAKKGHTSGG